MLLEAELRMRMQVAAQRGQLGVLSAEIFNGAHENWMRESARGSVRRHQALDAQAGVDGVVEQVDGEIDQHKNQRDEA